MRGNIAFVFMLMALLVVVAYSAGLVSDAQAVATGLTRLINAITGRTASGQFAAYPGNASVVNPTQHLQ